MHFRNKKFYNQQDFGKKWRTFSKTGFRGQEPRGFRASLLTGLYYRLRYCNPTPPLVSYDATLFRWQAFTTACGIATSKSQTAVYTAMVDRPLLPLAVLQPSPSTNMWQSSRLTGLYYRLRYCNSLSSKRETILSYSWQAFTTACGIVTLYHQ